jgi:sugar/nucleoside kinase (ribokinase family)
VYKRIDNRTYEYVQRVGGKLTTTARTVVAADGKTRTITTTGKDAQGRTINNVAFYDRQ